MDYVGYIDDANRFSVCGWVADRHDWEQSLRVDILVNGQPQGFAHANEFREGLAQLNPAATGRYAFRYYFANPLSMYRPHEVTVRVSNSNYFLTRIGGSIGAIKPDPNTSSARPSGPILLSTSGRTGSTLVMATLAQHPNVVVAGDRPYEVEMACYYSYALRTLLAAGDQSRSLRTDRITATENRFHIGFNPYFDYSFSSVFKNRETLWSFLSDRVPARLSQAFRDIILDYYQEVAADQGIEHPIYFAEKSLPERDSRLGVRFMFPNVREIVLVRDLRDVLCSSIATKNAEFEPILKATVAAGQQFVNILDEARPGLMLLKYEDYIERKEQTVAHLYEFLGLSAVREDTERTGALFDVHATSKSPTASIGRWRDDLTPDQKARCEVLAPYLERLGYAV